MTDPLPYTGTGKPSGRPLPPTPTRRLSEMRPDRYLADEGLKDAVNTALLLGRPLLLTGEPGTGKTQLAYSLAHELGLESLRFDAKSTSRARDLFYTFDALGHFQAAQSGLAKQGALPFLTFQALGTAILRTNPAEAVRDLLLSGAAHDRPRRSLVLLDEIDKAPRDFPNDVLAEVEEGYFRIPELGNREVRSDEALQPVLVITSNSEKQLPDAFLRRCVYYHIPFPGGTRLAKILDARLRDGGPLDPGFLRDALSILKALRESPDVRKKPATAEVLAWMSVLRASAPDQPNPLGGKGETARRCLGALVKTEGDLRIAERVVTAWIAERSAH